MLQHAFTHQDEVLAEAFKEGKGLTLYCGCGAGLKQIPLDKTECVLRRRCPECKQRWKLTVFKKIGLRDYAARFQKIGQKSKKRGGQKKKRVVE